MINKIITNQEISKQFPQIKYFINSWSTGSVDATQCLILCSKGFVKEGQLIDYCRGKKDAIDQWRDHFYKYIKDYISGNPHIEKDISRVLIWRVWPEFEEIEIDNITLYSVYARFIIKEFNIESRN